MKKTALLATAVAMAISGSAMAASHGGTKFYGKMELNLHNNENLYMDSGKLIIGWKGSEDLGNGMKVGFGLELENDSADAEKTGWSNDKSFITLSGDFGTVIMGRAGSFRNWGCYSDIGKYDFDRACDASGQATAYDNLLAYVGGAGDISFGVGMVFAGSATVGDDAKHTTAAVKYAGGAVKAGASVVNIDGGASFVNFGGSYDLGGMVISANTGSNDGEATGVDVTLSMGMGKGAKAYVGMTTESTNGVASHESSVQLGYVSNLSKRTYMKVEYQDIDTPDGTLRGTLGHKF